MNLESLAFMFICLETAVVSLLAVLKIRTWRRNMGVYRLMQMLAGISVGYFLQSALVALVLIAPAQIIKNSFGLIFVGLMLLAALPINIFCLYALSISDREKGPEQ